MSSPDDTRIRELLDQLERGPDGVLHDPRSGRTLVLNATSTVFFDILTAHRELDAAVEAVRDRFGLSPQRAGADLAAFLDLLDPGQRCVGTLLPGRHHAVLEPTATCNGGCPHCYHATRTEHWPREQITPIVARLADAGVRSVSITGGEVFSPHYVDTFFDLLATLERHRIAVASVSSNATFVSEQVRDRIIDQVDPTTVFRLSLDALHTDLLRRVRPGYRGLADPYAPIADLDAAGYPLVFSTNVWTQPPSEITGIGEYLRRFTRITAWNIRLAVPVHHAGNRRIREAARQRHLYQARPEPTLPLHHFSEVLARHADEPYPFAVRMGNYLLTELLTRPHAIRTIGPGHPCREDTDLITVKATGRITRCPILPELNPDLTTGSVLDPTVEVPGDTPLSGLHTDSMECGSCPLRPVCGGGCRLYPLAFDGGPAGCDETARVLLIWILADPTGLLRRHWPAYHRRMRELAPHADIGILYETHLRDREQPPGGPTG